MGKTCRLEEHLVDCEESLPATPFIFDVDIASYKARGRVEQQDALYIYSRNNWIQLTKETN